MELNEYNGFEDHCKNTEIDMKRKFEHKDSHNIDAAMEQIMQRKDQEFIDHSLLAPEYMRDPNHFIMDLMNFPKTDTASHSNADDNLPTDLHFHNSLFPVTTEDHQHHSNAAAKTPPSSVFMPLNNDFLMPVQKSYNTSVGSVDNVEENGVKVVQQLLLTTENNVALDDSSLNDDCDLSSFNSRKVLPHKKRISRKLKINHCDTDLHLNVPLTSSHKLPNVDQLVGVSVQQFRCELCGHATCSQLEFFAHLKQHYEPSTPDTILAAMKTSLEALGPEKTEEASDLCVINKKTDGLDQVFQDVHFPFDNFTQNTTVDDAVRAVMEPQHVDSVDIKMDEAMNATTSALQQQQHTQPQQQQQQPQTTPNLVPEEFSDTEDMLEGIRDKVLIEDTCDTMDLMTPTSNGVRPHWFTNTCFNGIDLKAKPFCDVLFSGQFAPMLNTENPGNLMQQHSHLSDSKIMNKEMHPPPPLPNLQPLALTLQSHAHSQSQSQSVQHATDLRLHFPQPESLLGQDRSTSLHEQQHQITQEHRIKIENTHPTDLPTLQNFQNSESLTPPRFQNSQNSPPPHLPDIPSFQNSENATSTDIPDMSSFPKISENPPTTSIPDISTFRNSKNTPPPPTKIPDISTFRNSKNTPPANIPDISTFRNSENTPPTNIPDISTFQNSEDTLSGNEQDNVHYQNAQQSEETDEEYYSHLAKERGEAEFYNRQSNAGKVNKEFNASDNDDENLKELCMENDAGEDDGIYEIGEEDDEDEDEATENGKRKKYVCKICQRIFNSCNALKYHHRTHSGLRPHQCDICNKSFFAVGALKAHTRTHTGDKPFECEHCDRKFRQWGDLKYHTISIHSSEKNHQCEFCGKAFSRKYSLVVHLRIHTSERNYKCEFCTKTFRASTYLQNHRKIHTGEKPYECDVCTKKFRVSGDLRRHQRIHERKRLKQDLKENANSAKSAACN